MLRLTATVLFALALAAPALAHDWYPPGCCHGTDVGGDCHPVACEELSEQNDGAWKWRGYTFSKDRVHPSQDKTCHVCVFHEVAPMCVFIQMGT